MRTIELIGSGHSIADIISDRLPASYGHNKFIGYVASKDEYIIASHAVPHGYCWSEYYMSLDSLLDALINEYNDHAQAMEVVNYMEHRQQADYGLKVEEVKKGIFSLTAYDLDDGSIIYSETDGHRGYNEAMDELGEQVGYIDLDRREENDAIKYDGRY